MKQKIKINKNILMSITIAFLAGILSYFWIPTEEHDLYRYYIILDKLNYFNKEDVLKLIFERGEIITMGYFWIISQLGNYQLLQFFPTFIFYIIFSYIILDYSKLNLLDKKKIVFVFIFSFCLYKYISIVSGIRNALSFMIFVLALYFDYKKNKKSLVYKILYIIPLFIHTSSIILIVLRMFSFIKNNKLQMMIYFLLTLVLINPLIISDLINIIKIVVNIEFLDFIQNRILLYYENIVFTLNNQSIYRLFECILFIIIFIFVGLKNNNIKEFILANFYNHFTFIILLFTCLIFKYFSVYMRFIDLSQFLMIPIFIDYLKLPKTNGKYIINIIIWIFIIGGFRIQIPIFQNMFF